MSDSNHVNERKDYTRTVLLEEHAGKDPFALFGSWLRAAEDDGVPEFNSMMLATSGTDRIGCRVVLLRAWDARGFTFFTNYNSAKAIELDADPRAALTFFWPTHERQVRISGHAEKLTAKESDDYFHSRPRESRIGAWASDQSAEIKDRETLDERVVRWTKRFADSEVPRPGHWGGYRIVPVRIEFWQGRASRLHDRLVFEKSAEGYWHVRRLQP